MIDKALQYVSETRSYLGAIQNRLEHAYNANANTQENTEASEMRIRDTDIAKEMVKYHKESVLEQATQSILAQANQSKQGIVGLIQ